MVSRKILGISGSPRSGQTTDRLVQAVLSSCDGETEFVSLAGKTIGPCIACLGCVETSVCALKDDMAELRERLLEADALVIGAPTYSGMVHGLTHCFLERFYQFRHRDEMLLAGKLGVAVGVGGRDGAASAQQIAGFLDRNGIRCVGTVSAQGAFACHSCGYGGTCTSGGIYSFYGPEASICVNTVPDLSKQPWKIAEAEAMGRRLTESLSRM